MSLKYAIVPQIATMDNRTVPVRLLVLIVYKCVIYVVM